MGHGSLVNISSQRTLGGTTYSTIEKITDETWTDNKPIYVKTYTGTTPNNSYDNLIFTVNGATNIIKFFGKIVQQNNGRSSDIMSLFSGSTPHGSMYQFYNTNELHCFNSTGDARHQNCQYEITVYYTK